MLLALVSLASGLLSLFFACVALNTSKPYRVYFLLPILVPAAIGALTSKDVDRIVPQLGALWAHGLLAHVIHNTGLLYIEKWVLHSDPKCKGWDFHAAYKICFNPQLLGTSKEVPHAHPVTKGPSRLRFLGKWLGQLFLLHLINDFVVIPFSAWGFASLSVEDFSAPRRVYFRRLLQGEGVTRSETLLRSAFAFRWMWNNYIGLLTAQTAIAILFSVILRWDEPWEWPRLFGSPLEAWNLRRFWGRFWHRLVYRPYTTYGVWISRNILGVRAGSLGEKVSVAMLVFFLSGLMHALLTWHSLGCGYWGDVNWFLLNGVFTVGETMVVKLWSARFNAKAGAGRGMFLRLLGYVWLFTFMFWSVPKWEYGKIHCTVSGMA